MEFRIFFLKWTLSEVSCVILQFRFWGSYIIYPFSLFLDKIFMVPSDYQTLIDSKMQQYTLYIDLYPRFTARSTWDSLLTSLYLVPESNAMGNIKAIFISAKKMSFWQHCTALVDTRGFIYYTLRKNVLFFIVLYTIKKYNYTNSIRCRITFTVLLSTKKQFTMLHHNRVS